MRRCKICAGFVTKLFFYEGLVTKTSERERSRGLLGFKSTTFSRLEWYLLALGVDLLTVVFRHPRLANLAGVEQRPAGVCVCVCVCECVCVCVCECECECE